MSSSIDLIFSNICLVLSFCIQWNQTNVLCHFAGLAHVATRDSVRVFITFLRLLRRRICISVGSCANSFRQRALFVFRIPAYRTCLSKMAPTLLYLGMRFSLGCLNVLCASAHYCVIIFPRVCLTKSSGLEFLGSKNFAVSGSGSPHQTAEAKARQ